MSVESYISSVFQLLPPDGHIQLTRKMWAQLLEKHGAGPTTLAQPTTQPTLTPPAAARAIYTVEHLTEVLPRRASTIRGLLSDGLCGDPETLKPNTRTFEVPGRVVEALLAQLAEGHALNSFCLFHPELPWKSASQVPHSSTETDTVPADCAAPAAPEPTSIAAPSSAQTPQLPALPAGDKANVKVGVPKDATPPTKPKATCPSTRAQRTAPAAAPARNTKARVTDLGAWRAHLSGGASV